MTTPPPLTPDEIAALRKLHEEATAGVWRREMMELGPGGPMTLGVGTEERPVCIVHGIVESPVGTKNANFIAAAHNHFEALLAACERAAALEAFLEEHGATIESWLCPSNGESQSEDDRAIIACLEAFRALRGTR